MLGVRMPGLSGLDLQKRMTQSGVDLPIIVLTGHGDLPMSVPAMKAGVVEFLTKPVRGQDLLGAIEQTLERWLSRFVASPSSLSPKCCLNSGIGHSDDSFHFVLLTGREVHGKIRNVAGFDTDHVPPFVIRKI